MTAGVMVSHPPCRGRRPRRPAAAVFASLTAFRPPRPGRGMISRHIMRHTARFPPAVGVGVLDDPFLRPPTAPRCRRGCGRRRPPATGGPPARVPPLPPPALLWRWGIPRAAARGQGSAPGPRPLFCQKAGQKTFRRQSTSSPSPSPLGRVIQSVREADTLAAEWHLPREWERRVGPETSRGRHHPISVFFGAPPRFFGQDQRNGVEQAA